ncbi:efflux RND transporter periplasmic adaptor subunit [bacterium]|nr:efflux RND transporter periplasmic adaptor subunit [bacterium]
MKKIIGFAIGGAILLFLILGIARSRQSEEALSISKIQQQEGIPVYAEKAELGTVRVIRSYYGTVRSKNQAVVSAKVMDRIDRIFVDAGDRVKKGQVVVRFDTTASQASVSQARLQFQNMKRDYERMKKLFDDGAISKQQLDQIELGYNVAQENYQTSRRSVELIAPISGLVARIDTEEGAIAFPGDALLKIVSDDKYEVAFDVTQEDRNKLKAGQMVRVYFDGDDGVEGKITHVGLATSDMSRLFTAYASFPASEGIYPGILASVNVTVEQRSDVLQLPVQAILDRHDSDVVVAIDGDTAVLRSVKLGLTGEGNVEILDGLAPGTMVATYGHKAIEDGSLVRVIDENNETASAR